MAIRTVSTTNINEDVSVTEVEITEGIDSQIFLRYETHCNACDYYEILGGFEVSMDDAEHHARNCPALQADGDLN